LGKGKERKETVGGRQKKREGEGEGEGEGGEGEMGKHII
jgi:hypothetical protein